jgi:uncharacterized membrane protein
LRFLKAFIILLFITSTNYFVSYLLNGEFIEYSAIVGLAFVLLIKFFNSSGGLSTNMMRMKVQSQTGVKVDEERKTFNPSITFYIAIAYTVVAILASIFYYKDYFM